LVLRTVVILFPFSRPARGPFLAALFPTVLAFAIDPGWTMLFWVIALFLVIELIINNAVEPWLYGSSTGLSSLAIILAAVFWTTLWGPVGLFLATPLLNTVVRVTEREADAFGINASREPDGMAKVALKLGAYRKLNPTPVEEFIFYDHPSGRARIRMAMDWKAANLSAGESTTAETRSPAP